MVLIVPLATKKNNEIKMSPRFTSEKMLFFAKIYLGAFTYDTAQKMKFSIKDLFSKCDQIRGNLIFCAL